MAGRGYLALAAAAAVGAALLGWSGAVGAAPMKVAFLVSSSLKSEFWFAMARPMQAAAEDLDIELYIYEAEQNHLDYVRQAGEAIGKAGVRYLIIKGYKNVGLDIIKMADSAGVGVFVVNAPVSDVGADKAGQPRQIHPSWIGSRLPDDEGAGYNLMQALLLEARALGLSPIRVLALNGERADPPSVLRGRGLARAMREAADAQLLEDAPVALKEDARARALAMLTRYPETNVLWCKDDGIAQDAVDALGQLGRRPGKDIVLGGIDWRPKALEAVERGEVAISVGGHFIEGLAALALVYDHSRGQDFAQDVGLTSATAMVPMPRALIPDFRRLFLKGNLYGVDYRVFTLAHGGQRDFSVLRLLDLLRDAEAKGQ